MWRKGFSSTNGLYRNLGADVLMLVISFVVTVFLAPLDIWNIGSFIASDVGVFALYALFVLVSLYPFILLVNLIIAQNEEAKYKVLTRLGEYRSEGVDLRNNGFNLNTEEAVELWVNDVIIWQEDTLSEYKKANPARAEIWNTLDTFTPKAYGRVVNRKHRQYLDILSTALERLKSDLDYMLDNIDK